MLTMERGWFEGFLAFGMISGLGGLGKIAMIDRSLVFFVRFSSLETWEFLSLSLSPLSLML